MYGVNLLVHHQHMRKKVITRFKAKYRPKPNFIRKWHKSKPNLSLERLCERLTEAQGCIISHSSLSRIERGLQGYSQRLLEAIAAELTNGDEASLLIRDPTDPEGIWSIWDNAKPAERELIVGLAKTVLKKVS
jgi:hypothetical protein